jgi:hypothetical protein
MKSPGSIRSLAAACAALSLVTGSAASATAAPSVTNPLVTLSIFGSSQSRAALCAAGSAAAAGAASSAAQSGPGCVLPVADAPPPAVASEALPPMTPYAAAAPAAANVWPLLATLAAFGGAFFLLDDVILGDGGDFEFDVPPCTDSPC